MPGTAVADPAIVGGYDLISPLLPFLPAPIPSLPRSGPQTQLCTTSSPSRVHGQSPGHKKTLLVQFEPSNGLHSADNDFGFVLRRSIQTMGAKGCNALRFCIICIVPLKFAFTCNCLVCLLSDRLRHWLSTEQTVTVDSQRQQFFKQISF